MAAKKKSKSKPKSRSKSRAKRGTKRPAAKRARSKRGTTKRSTARRAKRPAAKRRAKRGGTINLSAQGVKHYRGRRHVIVLKDPESGWVSESGMRSNPKKGKKMKKAKKKHRKNPRMTKTSGRVLHPENCKRKVSAKMMSMRRKQRAQHKRLTKGVGTCRIESAQLALHQTPKLGRPSKRGSTYGGQGYKGPKPAGKQLVKAAKARSSRSKSRSKSMRRNPTSGPSLVNWFWK